MTRPWGMPVFPTSSRPGEISDGVVALRPWREDDVSAQLAAWRDPTFQRFSDWAPRSARESLQRIDAQRLVRAEDLGAAFAICEPAPSDQVLGEVSVNGVDATNRAASIGYWLTPAARGRGVVTRAVRLASQFAFDHMGLVRVELSCGPDNVASAAVAIRAGFTYERRLRSNLLFKGARRDSLTFGLLRDDVIG